MKLLFKNNNLQKILNFLIKLFLFILPWQTIYIFRESFVGGFKVEPMTLGFYATEALLWVIVVLFMWWYWKNWKLRNLEIKKFTFTKDRIFLLSILFFISYLFISILWSVDKDLALQQSLHIMEAFLLFFILFLGPLNFNLAVKWLIAGAILPSVLGIWQFLTQSSFASTFLGLSSHPVWQAGSSIIQSDAVGRWLRAYGTFSHPNVFGGYLIVALLALLLSQKSDIVLLSLFCVLMVALFFTFSRSAWLAFLVVFLFFGVISFKQYLKDKNFSYSFIVYYLSLIIIILLSTFYFPLLQTRTSDSSISEVRSVQERIVGYHEAWQIFKRQSLLGVGSGNYVPALIQLKPNLAGYEYQPVHNVFALFLVEQGLMGVGLLLFIILSLISYLLSLEKQIGDRRYEIFLSVVCYLLLCSFDHYLYSSYIGLMLSAIFFGLLLRKDEINTNLV